jgi:hypothetical protein
MGVMIYYVELRAFALCFLNLPPSFHSILDFRIQVGSPCPSLGYLTESPIEAVVSFDIVGRRYHIRVVDLDFS